MKASKKELPNWPDHPAAQAGIVCDKSGDLMKESLNWKYRRSTNKTVLEIRKDQMKEAAVDTAVAAIRFLENL